VDAVRTLRDVSATRTLRAELLALAMAAERAPDRTETLRLIQPRLSEQRIDQEWRSVAAVLRPKVVRRLSLQVVFPDGHSKVLGAPGEPLPEEAATARPRPPRSFRLGRRDVAFAVEKLLIWSWLMGKGPVTRVWLQRSAGCAYPAVAAVVKRLGSAVCRHADRRIELKHVPRQEWARFFAVSGSARSTLRFADRSDQPSSASALLRRLRRLAPAGVAVGGVAGARHYSSDLDLIGLPSLALSIHAPDRDVDLGFVRRLEPALKPVPDSTHPAVMAIHFIRHREPLFVGAHGVPWADPVECLLDLHEAGLESQAFEFLDRLRPQGAARP
jgi:hypothetical protein